jgi:hypothetical protein
MQDCIIDTIPITNPDTGIEKDTVIVFEYSSRMVGKWYEFDSTGNLSKTVDYGQQPVWRYGGFTEAIKQR